MSRTVDAAGWRPNGWVLARIPRLLGSVAFRRYWTGHSISMVGDQISVVAVPLVAVLELHAAPREMGYLTAAGTLPFLLFSLHAGAWSDRHGRRRQAMLTADVARASLLASIPVTAALGMLTFAQLYAVMFLVGSCSVLFWVSDSALFQSLVAPADYVEANSLLHGSRAMSFVLGPSLGGLLVQVLTAPLAVLADAFSFVASALSLAWIRPPEPAPAAGQRGQLAAGARFIRESPIIRASLLSTATVNLFTFMFAALFILYATEDLHVPPGTLGLVLGAGAVGGVVGSLVTKPVSRRIGIGWTFVLGSAIFPAPLLLVPAAGGPRPLLLSLLFLAELGSGFGVMLLDIAGTSISAALVPRALRARVSGAYSVVNFGVRPLGSLAGGLLGTLIGVRTTLWVAAIGGVLSFLWLLPSPIRSLRTLPSADPGSGEPASLGGGADCGQGAART